MPAYTPGPWIYNDLGWISTGGDLDTTICRVSIEERVDEPMAMEEQDANGRLIAAAPDLLDALLGLIHNHVWEVGDRYVAAARAAIAKAEGISQWPAEEI